MKKDYIVELREEEADELMDEHWVGELVRCKNCKFRGNINLCPLAYIEKTEQFTALCVDEWFCGNGKRKEGW